MDNSNAMMLMGGLWVMISCAIIFYMKKELKGKEGVGFDKYKKCPCLKCERKDNCPFPDGCLKYISWLETDRIKKIINKEEK